MYHPTPRQLLIEATLTKLTNNLGNEYYQLGVLLNVARPFIERLENDFNLGNVYFQLGLILNVARQFIERLENDFNLGNKYFQLGLILNVA